MNTTSKKNILVVEDAGIDRDIVSLFLQEKYNVILAENGLVAEQILESGQSVALILLDIIMPVVDGFGFLEWIQGKKEYQDIPIVLSSFEATDENILKGLTLGIRDIIFKPYDWDDVINRVDSLIALADMRNTQIRQPQSDADKKLVCKTALIVDDSPLSRDILIETLPDSYNFMTAANGLEALDILRTHHQEIDLVFLDLIMPEMDGFEMMKAATRENLLADIPVIAVTMDESPAHHLQLLEVGVSEIIQKPFSPAILQSKLDNLLELHQRHQSHT